MRSTKRKKIFFIRKARLVDVRTIHHLINNYAKRRILLPRSLNYIYDNIRDYFVCENSRHRVVACCALHIAWENLAEVKSLAVGKSYQGNDIGRRLLQACVDDAKRLGAKRVFALTYIPRFFVKSGFKRIRKSKLPAKIWRECIDCSLFPDCEEIAVVKEL